MKETTPKEEIQSKFDRLRKLANSARCEEAHALAKKLMTQHPHDLRFAYMEAVMGAEDDTGYSPAQIKARHARAAKKLKALLRRLNGSPLAFRSSIRNEYYWFSHQPLKQYRLGIQMVQKGHKRSYYSQGVGAEELAKAYALKGNRTLCLRWAKRSEKAWLKFFNVDPNWFNSYFFYAMAVGYQGRIDEMEAALKRAAKIIGKSTRWSPLEDVRRDVRRVLKALGDESMPAR